MSEDIISNFKLKKNRELFQNEIKMFINQRLFDKNLITEEMYAVAKEKLIKKAS